MVGKTDGGRRRGRQRTRWIHDVTNSTGRRLEELKELPSTGMCGKGLCMMSPGVARDLMDAERESM